MADEEDGPGRFVDLAQLLVTAPLVLGIADGEDLVEDQDLRFEMRGDGEPETDTHARTVAFDGRIEEPFDARERDDLVELAADLPAAHPQDRAVQINVLASGQFGMKAGADL